MTTPATTPTSTSTCFLRRLFLLGLWLLLALRQQQQSAQRRRSRNDEPIILSKTTENNHEHPINGGNTHTIIPLPENNKSKTNDDDATTTTVLSLPPDPMNILSRDHNHPFQNNASEAAVGIPKHIFLFWEQGWPATGGKANRAPEANLVRRSWEYYHPNWTVYTLNGPQVRALTQDAREALHIANATWSQMSIQAKSDVYRTLLLYQYGGIWVDASLFCNQPLEQWFQSELESATDLVAFQRTDPPARASGIDPYVSSWFLAAPPQAPLVSLLVRELQQPHQHVRMTSEYFWWHRWVGDLARRDAKMEFRIRAFRVATPSLCQMVGWTTTAPVVKRCANGKLFRLFWVTTHQCCCGQQRPEEETQRMAQVSLSSNTTLQQKWQALCQGWNCQRTTANMPKFQRVVDLMDDGLDNAAFAKRYYASSSVLG